MTPAKQPKKTLRIDAARLIEICPAAKPACRAAHHPVLRARDGETGLRWRKLGLMAQIAAASDDTLGALAARTGLEQSTLSRNLRRSRATGSSKSPMVESDLRRRRCGSPRPARGGSRPPFRSGARRLRSWTSCCRRGWSGDWRRKPKPSFRTEALRHEGPTLPRARAA